MGDESVERAGGISAEDKAKAWRVCCALNGSRMQEELRAERRWFCGAVYWQPGDYEVEALRRELRRMREIGFNVVCYQTCDPVETEPGRVDFSRSDVWMDEAGEAGMQVLAHFPFGRPGSQVLRHHGLTLEEYYELGFQEPMVARIMEEYVRPVVERYRTHPALMAWMLGTEPALAIGSMAREIHKKRFASWLRARYQTPAKLDRAWNLYPEKGKLILGAFDDAWRLVQEGGRHGNGNGGGAEPRNRGAMRDLMCFQADHAVARERRLVELVRRYDSSHPVGIVSRGLLGNGAVARRDFSGLARSADFHGGVIDLSRDFALAEGGEIERPMYVQARMVRDLFKNGWSGAYETMAAAAGSAGGYGTSMSAGLIRAVMLSSLAAGHMAMGFWAWNARLGAGEAGESALTTLSGQVSAWGDEAGHVARGLERYREELWEAREDVRAGILQNWDNEAMLALEPECLVVAEGGRKMQASRAYLGAGRALMNGRMGFEFVMAEEVIAGIALCYPAIYVPHMRAMSDELVARLREYVERGGRLIADVQFGSEDPWGKARRTGVGKPVEQIFGAFVDGLHETRAGEIFFEGQAIEGFYADVVVTDATVVGRFEDGRAAITERKLGQGTAVLVGFDLAHLCRRRGNGAMEGLLRRLVGGEAPWQCDAPLAFRRSAAGADHYFLINDGAARMATLQAERVYRRAEDVIDGKAVEVGGGGAIRVELAARSGLWLRCAC